MKLCIDTSDVCMILSYTQLFESNTHAVCFSYTGMYEVIPTTTKNFSTRIPHPTSRGDEFVRPLPRVLYSLLSHA
jgi:hypothetical protein